MFVQGSKPPTAAERAGDLLAHSGSPSPCSSYQVSPRASSSSSHITLGAGCGGGYFGGGVEGSSLIPWLKNLSSSTSNNIASSSKYPGGAHHPYFNGGSISAPVTPPSGSPPRTPRFKRGWGEYPGAQVQPPWAGAGSSGYGSYNYNYASLPNSTPPSPRGRKKFIAPDPAWLAGFQISSAGPSSPTYNLMASQNPFVAVREAAAAATAGSSRMYTPGQSGACSPVVGGAGLVIRGDTHMADRAAAEDFAFGNGGGGGNGRVPGLLKAWEGERIHEESASDELELTLGNSSTRAGANQA